MKYKDNFPFHSFVAAAAWLIANSLFRQALLARVCLVAGCWCALWHVN